MSIFSYFKRKHNPIATEDVSSMSYHEDMKIDDKTKVLNYVVELLKFKRNKFLSFQAKQAPGSFQRLIMLFVMLLLYAIIKTILVKDFQVVLKMVAGYGLGFVLTEIFLIPRLYKKIVDQSYVAFDREINNTISSKGFNIFGVDMEDEHAFSNPHDLSNIQVFRNDINHEIVGVVCLKPMRDLQEQEENNNNKIVLEIGILGSSAVDEISKKIQEEMFDWCLTKAQVLKQSSKEDVFLQIEILGIASGIQSFLRANKFKPISYRKTGNSSLFDSSSIFKMQLWELKV